MVSVIIPTYNRAKKIKDAVESVINQTWKDLEVIVIDDGSTDNTKEVLTTIIDSRIRYEYQQNSGACVARNRGITLSRGEYIAFHDSDDVWLPTKLQEQMEKIEKTNADILFCKYFLHYASEKERKMPEKIREGFLTPITNLFGIGTPTLIAKRSVFEEYKFDVSFPRFQELEMLYRATKKYSLYCMDKALVLVDYNDGRTSISHNVEKLYDACYMLMKKHPTMTKEYPVMGQRMARDLLTATSQISDKKNRNKFIQLSLMCSKNLKIVLKIIIIKCHLYSLWRKFQYGR